MSKWIFVCVATVTLSSVLTGSNGSDDPLIFMPPYRCLDRAYEPVGPRGRFTPRRRDIRDLMSEIHSEQTLKDKPDCGVIDPAWCEADDEGQLFSIPCNCHAYFSCNILDASAKLKPCPHWCEPRSLVFDPNTQSCVKFDQAPPGVCYDTPSTPDPTVPTTEFVPTTTPEPTPEPTTEKKTTTPKITTPEPTTTPKPTTTPEPTTTPKPTTTAAPTTTPDASADCDFDGQKLPYPGNCHDYYVCFEDGNGSGNFHVQVFSCGDDWVYDPNTGSCTWPEEAADDLCDY